MFSRSIVCTCEPCAPPCLLCTPPVHKRAGPGISLKFQREFSYFLTGPRDHAATAAAAAASSIVVSPPRQQKKKRLIIMDLGLGKTNRPPPPTPNAVRAYGDHC